VVNSSATAVSDNLNRRTTSHAKTLDLTEHNTALDRARALKEQFERANAVQGPSHEQLKTRPPDPPKRATSHAKTVTLTEQKTALDRARALKAEFDRTRAAPPKAREQDNSRQVETVRGRSHAPRAEQDLKPKGEIRRAVDRQIDKEKLAKENQRALALNQAYKELQQQQKGRDLNRDRGTGRSYGR
jgi:hypothetical protein